MVSTIFVQLDLPGSDIDIICCHQKKQDLKQQFEKTFSRYDDFVFSERENYCIGRFYFDGFPFEVYSSNQLVRLQLGYRHFKIMETLSQYGGEPFRSKVRLLKTKGYKTEPAICEVLSLTGDPYISILQVEQWSSQNFKHFVENLVL